MDSVNKFDVGDRVINLDGFIGKVVDLFPGGYYRYGVARDGDTYDQWEWYSEDELTLYEEK